MVKVKKRSTAPRPEMALAMHYLTELKEQHSILMNRYRTDGAKAEKMWRSFDQGLRERTLLKGAVNGRMLRHPLDKSMGSICNFLPEWNLRDLAAPSSDYFLEMLKYRATTPLVEQFNAGFNEFPGDHAHILNMAAKKQLSTNYSAKYDGLYVLFTEGDYGRTVQLNSTEYSKLILTLTPGFGTQQVVHLPTGELILMRQKSLIGALNVALNDVLRSFIGTRAEIQRIKSDPEGVAAAIARPSIHSAPKSKIELTDLIDNSLEQATYLKSHLNTIRNEPSVLAHEVKLWFSTHLGLIVDEKGRKLPVHTDDHISGAMLDAVHDAVKKAAVWDYINRLLSLLHDEPTKQFRAIILQELSNTCQLEYTRAQAMLKRLVSSMSGGGKWFKRMSAAQSKGSERICLKRNIESLVDENPQLHHLLQLCQDDTSCLKATELLQKLEDLHRSYPSQKEKMTEEEFGALGEFTLIVTLIWSLSQVARVWSSEKHVSNLFRLLTPLKVPSASSKKGQTFVSGFLALETDLNQLKSGLNLSDFVVPIKNLTKPGKAVGALAALDGYIIEEKGKKLGFLYQDLVDHGIADLQGQHKQQKAKASAPKKKSDDPTAPETPESPNEQDKENEETLKPPVSLYEIVPEAIVAGPSDVALEAGPAEPRERFTVKPATKVIFASLLAKSPADLVPFSWDAFEAAMTDVGFTVVSKVASVCTFAPPEKLSSQKKLTLYRPNHSQVNGQRLQFFSSRLKDVYGWDDETFVAE